MVVLYSMQWFFLSFFFFLPFRWTVEWYSTTTLLFLRWNHPLFLRMPFLQFACRHLALPINTLIKKRWPSDGGHSYKVSDNTRFNCAVRHETEFELFFRWNSSQCFTTANYSNNDQCRVQRQVRRRGGEWSCRSYDLCLLSRKRRLYRREKLSTKITQNNPLTNYTFVSMNSQRRVTVEVHC